LDQSEARGGEMTTDESCRQICAQAQTLSHNVKDIRHYLKEMFIKITDISLVGDMYTYPIYIVIP
jgi:hypothetical protein